MMAMRSLDRPCCAEDVTDCVRQETRRSFLLLATCHDARGWMEWRSGGGERTCECCAELPRKLVVDKASVAS